MSSKSSPWWRWAKPIIVYHRDSRLRGRCILMVLANNDRPIITAFLPPWSVGAAHVPVQNYQYVEFDSDGHHDALYDWKMCMWLVPRYYATTVHLNARVSPSLFSNRRIQCESFNWVEADWSFPPQMYVMYYGPRTWTFVQPTNQHINKSVHLEVWFWLI